MWRLWPPYGPLWQPPDMYSPRRDKTSVSKGLIVITAPCSIPNERNRSLITNTGKDKVAVKKRKDGNFPCYVPDRVTVLGPNHSLVDVSPAKSKQKSSSGNGKSKRDEVSCSHDLSVCQCFSHQQRTWEPLSVCLARERRRTLWPTWKCPCIPRMLSPRETLQPCPCPWG